MFVRSNPESRKRKAPLYSLLAAAFAFLSATFANADIEIKSDESGAQIRIDGRISASDAEKLSLADRNGSIHGLVHVVLRSKGGEVAAATRIGRILREAEAWVVVPQGAVCMSSCALIYMSGVQRSNMGFIGIHRPYFDSAPLNPDQVKSQYSRMAAAVKAYIQEMGVTENVFYEMMNTEPAKMKLYYDDHVNDIIPKVDPAYQEVQVSAKAREYGVKTGEMRLRIKESDKCSDRFKDMADYVNCVEAIKWGLSESVYRRRIGPAREACWSKFNAELESLKAQKLKRSQSRQHPVRIKYDSCLRELMLGG
jgi:membrane-bound ClpP family serine protease